MNYKEAFWHRIGAGLLTAVVVLAASVTLAVVKDISVVSSDGTPIANTTVTIVFPDGTKKEEDTDDKGILIFDFPGKGDYRIIYPGGEMAYTVPGGVAPWVWAVTGVAVAGGGVAIASSGGGGNGPDAGSTSPPPSGSTSVDGNYSASTSVVSNPDGHPDNFNGATYTVATTGSQISIEVTSSGVSFSVSGSIDSSNNFSGTGTGNYAGFSTSFEIMGSFDVAAGTWSGTMKAGVDGALPDSNGDGTNSPIEVSFTGSKG